MSSVALSWIAAARKGLASSRLTGQSVCQVAARDTYSVPARQDQGYPGDERARPPFAAVPRPLRRRASERAARPPAATGADAEPPRLPSPEGMALRRRIRARADGVCSARARRPGAAVLLGRLGSARAAAVRAHPPGHGRRLAGARLRRRARSRDRDRAAAVRDGRDRDRLPERRELRVDPQAGRDRGARDDHGRRRSPRPYRPRRGRRHGGLLRTPHQLVVERRRRALRRSAGGGLEPGPRRQRPTF